MEELIKPDAYPVKGLLGQLLQDKTTGKNILFASDSYEKYAAGSQMTEEALLGFESCDIQPRVYKAAAEQTERTRKRAEVFTPAWIVNMMNNHCDAEWFGRENVFNVQNGQTWEVNSAPIIFPSGKDWKKYVDSRRLEITCGEAPFIVSRYDAVTGELIPVEKRVGVLDRKLRVVSENAVDESEWSKWALRAFQSVYGYEFQGDNLLIARINLLYTLTDFMEAKWHRQAAPKELKKFLNVICHNFWQMDGLIGAVPVRAAAETAQLSFFGELPPAPEEDTDCKIYDWRAERSLLFPELMKRGKKMKFDFVIGNPPYQEDRQGDSNTATPVYHNFMDAAYKISDKTMLITPARFLFNTGYTPKTWNEERLNDTHFKIIKYYSDSSEVFKNVDIKGGVVISYRDTSKNYGKIEVFTIYPVLNNIFHKIISTSEFKSITDIMVTSFAYHFTQTLYNENPNLYGKLSKGHDYDLQSNVFETFSEIFYDEKPKDNKEYIRILGRKGNQRCYKYICRDYITSVINLDKYKLFISKAFGNGEFGEIMPNMILGKPAIGSTITFLSVGAFDTEDEVIALEKYFKSKFARALLGVLKATQNGSKPCYRMIPLQDFTEKSDIDWSRSIAEIDKQLYRKYGLTQEEIGFIETHVKEME